MRSLPRFFILEIGTDIAGLRKQKTLEATIMSIKYLKIFTSCDGAVMSPSQFIDVPTVSGTRIFETINKTWHADCRITAVSKILDWLVK